MIAKIRLWLVLGLMLPLTVLLMPVQFLAVKLDLSLARSLPLFWHRLLVRMIGIRVRVEGGISQNTPVLLVANHVSWSDIIILGSVAKVCFIAKSEVAQTPFAGLLAQLQRSVFVKREERRKSAEQARVISQRLQGGDAIVLFAEGTTGDGHRLMAFKSSLFAAAHFALEKDVLEEIHIQPVAIAYTHFHGVPMGRLQRGRAAWPGDIGLAPHAVSFMQGSAWDVTVSFGEPLSFDGSQRRRDLARETREAIRRMYVASIYGHQA